MICIYSLVLVLVMASASRAATHFPGATWDTATPASQGMDSTLLDQFATAIGGQGIIVRHGYVVKTWGSQTEKFDWASSHKPLIGTLVLFAIQESVLSSFDELVDDWGWTMQGGDTTLTLRHLSNMVSGYARAEGPGAAWAYNDYAISLYCKTVKNIYGATTPDVALRNRLSALQFQDGTLLTTRDGCGLSTSVRDFARIGWWWLNLGNWNGTQILPSALISAHRVAQVPSNLPRTTASATDYLGVGTFGGGSDQTEYGPGIYGMNWWFNGMGGVHPSTLTWPSAPLDTFQANGHFVTEIMTMFPSLNLVVAARGDWGSFEPGNAASGMNQNFALLMSAVTVGPPVMGQATWCVKDANSLEGEPCQGQTPTAPGQVVENNHVSLRTAILNSSVNDGPPSSFALWCRRPHATGAWWAVDENCAGDGSGGYPLCRGFNTRRDGLDATTERLIVGGATFVSGGKFYESGSPQSDQVSLPASHWIEREHALRVRSDVAVGTTFGCCERYGNGAALETACGTGTEAIVHVVAPYGSRSR